VPVELREHLGAQVYGCDICQDVCPWNRGVELRRAGRSPHPGAHIDLVSWLEGDVASFSRLYVPRNDPRWLQRNALVAAGNAGGETEREAVERHADGDDPMLAEHARWALERMGARC
jgi:epoxyqueuosine reductase